MLIDAQDLTLPPPEREPQRQYYFIKKCREIVKKKSEELGRPFIDPGFVRVFAVYRQFFHDLVRLLPDIDDHVPVLEHGQKQLGEFEQIVCAEDQIHEAVTFPDLVDHGRSCRRSGSWWRTASWRSCCWDKTSTPMVKPAPGTAPSYNVCSWPVRSCRSRPVRADADAGRSSSSFSSPRSVRRTDPWGGMS
mgnify:CR=1 FL=1